MKARTRTKVSAGVLSAVIVTAGLTLSACGTGRFSATAICERSGGDYVGSTCEHRWTPAELAAQQWCETDGGVFLAHARCEWGSGGP
jgi:hypothetical protein